MLLLRPFSPLQLRCIAGSFQFVECIRCRGKRHLCLRALKEHRGFISALVMIQSTEQHRLDKIVLRRCLRTFLTVQFVEFAEPLPLLGVFERKFALGLLPLDAGQEFGAFCDHLPLLGTRFLNNQILNLAELHIF